MDWSSARVPTTRWSALRMRDIPPPQLKNILVLSLGGIANLLFMTPALQLLCERYPQARLTFLLSRNGSAEIVRHHPRLDRIVELGAPGQSVVATLMQLRSLHPDLSIVATGMNPAKSGLLCLALGVRRRVGESRGLGRLFYNVKGDYQFYRHEVLSNLRMAEAAGATGDAPALRVWSTSEDVVWAERCIAEHGLTGTRLLGIHPGSGASMAFKRWPVDRFIAASRALVDEFGFRVLVFGGADEAPLGAAVKIALGDAACDLTGKASILQSYEMMRRCALFLSNDSSPMHLAAAAGVPVAAIFGPTLDCQASPWGVANRVVKTDLACRPCYRVRQRDAAHFQCDTGGACACLGDITVGCVVENTRELLTEIGRV